MSPTCLVKTHYLDELTPISTTYKEGDTGSEVKRIKEWLILWQLDQYVVDRVITLDEHFDGATTAAVNELQNFFNLPKTGLVDEAMWQNLTLPLREATNLTSYNLVTSRQRQVYFASRHLQYHAAEINDSNLGPWVRSYVDGNEGGWAAWCMAFCCMILDQTFSSYGRRFDEVYLATWSCEKAREQAREKGLLRSHEDVLHGRYTPKPGDIALYIRGSSTAAHHAEIVYEVLDAKTGVMRAIGGNTNFAGSNHGVGVFLVNRNFLNPPDCKLDFIELIDALYSVS